MNKKTSIKDFIKLYTVQIIEVIFIVYIILTLFLEIQILVKQKTKEVLLVPKFEKIWELKFSEILPFSPNPQGLAVDKEGIIFIADPENKKVFSIDSNDYSKINLSQGDFSNQFSFTSPWGITSSDSEEDSLIWILDSGNGWVYRIFSPDQFDEDVDTAQYQVYNPKGLAIDRFGDFYIADTGNSRILKIDKNGKLVSEWGQYGERKNELKEPKGIIIIDDLLYILDSLNGRLVQYDLNGNLVGSWNIYTESNWIAKDPDNRIYVISSNSNMIQVFDKQGQLISNFTSTSIMADLEQVSLISFTSDGRMVICTNNQILMFNLSW